MKYASLHNHTSYSNIKLIDSINKVEELIDYGKELGLKAIAITDHDCLTSHITALNYFNKKYKEDNDYKLILGNEIYITREGLCKENHEKGEKFYHCILLAKDTIGHEQLRKLSSRAWDRSYMMAIMRTPTYLSDIEEIVSENPGHLICTTACIGGFCGVQFLKMWEGNHNFNGDIPSINNFLSGLKSLFGDDFYIELQPSFQPDQIAYNKYMINKFYDSYKFTVTTDAHYLKVDERKLHKDFLQSKESNGNREVDDFYSSAYLMSAEEVYDYLKYYLSDEIIFSMFNNSIEMADKCSGEYELFHEQIVPKIEYEWTERDPDAIERLREEIAEYGDKYPNLIPYFGSDANESDEYLAYLIAEGYYSGKVEPSEEYIARLDEELYHIYKISDRLGQPLSNYFNTMAKIIEIVWSEGDSLVGPGRGSGCGSLINYLVGITQLDPLRQELKMPFWRFLNESKIELPD